METLCTTPLLPAGMEACPSPLRAASGITLLLPRVNRAEQGGFLPDLGWEPAAASLSPAPRARSRWPERSPSLGGGGCRGNSTSAGAGLLLQEFPEKFPLRAALAAEP